MNFLDLPPAHTSATIRKALMAARESWEKRLAEQAEMDRQLAVRKRLHARPYDPIAALTTSRREELGLLAQATADAEAWKKLEARWSETERRPHTK